MRNTAHWMCWKWHPREAGIEGDTGTMASQSTLTTVDASSLGRHSAFLFSLAASQLWWPLGGKGCSPAILRSCSLQPKESRTSFRKKKSYITRNSLQGWSEPVQAEQTWTHTCRKKGLVRAVLGHPETDVTLVMLTQLHQELTQPALGADTAYLFDFIYTRAEQSRARRSLCPRRLHLLAPKESGCD